MIKSVTNRLAKQGHNSGGISGGQLLATIERIERLEGEKQALQEDIKEVYAEARSNGFDVKIIRQVVKYRKMSEQERREDKELLTSYMTAIGMQLSFDLAD